MTELERLEQRVRQLEDEREMFREALVTALKLHENSLRLLRRDHPYAEGQIDQLREIAAKVAELLKSGGGGPEDISKLASELIH